MKNLKDFTCYNKTKISGVLRIITKNKKKFCIVLDKKNNKIIGIVTDGDIRRSLLNGKNLTDKIDSAVNKKFIFSNDKNISRKLFIKLKKKKINFCPVLDTNKRVIDIIFINDDFINKYQIKAFILAGGLGKRLMPITKTLPKALVKVRGEPIIVQIFKKLKNNGFKDLIISVNHLANKIKSFLGNGKKLGVKISYVTENQPLGTAGSLSLIPKKILPQNLLILNCDLYTDLNFEDLVNFHFIKGVDATLCVKEKRIKQKFGIIKTNKEKIVDIKEKPIVKYFINAGIYIIDNER